MKTKLIMLALLAMQSACSGGSGADANASDGSTTTTSEIAKTNTGTVISNNDIHNVFATSSNAASGSTAASGSAVSSSVTSTAQSNVTVTTDVTTSTHAAPKPLTEKEKIDALEKLGKLPTLDRSDSLLGPDLDNNGIRDDIDAYILSQNFAEPQKKAAIQVAKAFSNILVADPSNPVSVESADMVLAKSLFCTYSIYPDKNLDKGIAINHTIEKITYNTKARVKTYLKYNAAMNGNVLSSPEGDTCE